MIKKYFVIIIFLMAAQTLLYGSDGEKRVLRLVNSSTFYPYSFVDESGKPSGILVDIWKLWGERNNVNIQFDLMEWHKSLTMIKNREADIHSGLFYSKERDKYIDFGKLKLRLDTGIYLHESLDIDSIDEIGNIEIAVNRGDYAIEYIREKYPEIKLKIYDSNCYIQIDLKQNKIKGWACDIPEAVFILNKFNLIGEYKMLELLYSKSLNYGVQEGNRELAEFINKGFEKIPAEEIETVYDKWIHYEQSTYYLKYFFIGTALFIVLSVFIFLAVNYFMLKAQVRNRTRELNESLKEKEVLIEDLEESMRKIKTLSGFLPICARCKKIRNDEGYWEQVEEYISQHSEAEFSHGICPNCAERLYGKGYKDFQSDE